MKKYILILGLLIPTTVFADWTPCGTDYLGRTANCEYQIDAEGTLTIRGTGDNGNIGRWEKNIERHPNAKLAPWYGMDVKNIVIEDSIKDLGYEGFYGMTSENPIIVPSSISTISEDAFQGISTPEVILPDSVETIAKWSFSLAKIEKINIPDSVKTIGYDAFMTMPDLKSIVIGNSVTSIGKDAFQDTSAYIYCQDTEARSCKDLIGENNQEALGKLRLYTVENGKIKVGSKTYISFDELPGYVLRRIYTIDEANAAAGDKNRVSIRYR